MRNLTQELLIGFVAVATLVSLSGCLSAPPPNRGTATGKIQRHESGDRTTTVRSGDTLESLADRFGTTVDALVRLNPDTAQRQLRAGQVIKLPTGKMPIRNVERRLRPASDDGGER